MKETDRDFENVLYEEFLSYPQKDLKTALNILIMVMKRKHIVVKWVSK